MRELNRRFRAKHNIVDFVEIDSTKELAYIVWTDGFQSIVDVSRMDAAQREEAIEKRILDKEKDRALRVARSNSKGVFI